MSVYLLTLVHVSMVGLVVTAVQVSKKNENKYYSFNSSKHTVVFILAFSNFRIKLTFGEKTLTPAYLGI